MGECLIEVGDTGVPFFVVVTGAVRILRASGSAETPIVTHRPGEFIGESNTIAGRPSRDKRRTGRLVDRRPFLSCAVAGVDRLFRQFHCPASNAS
jgi:CRP-like cAMP-binding protein